MTYNNTSSTNTSSLHHYNKNNTTTSGFEGYTGNPYVMSWWVEASYATVYLLMVLIAVGGNLVVIWVVVGNRRMRTVTNYFLVNLAVCDILITVFNTMFNFIYMCRSHWPFGIFYCKFISFVVPCTITASVFTFIAIAIDRYIHIMQPLTPRFSSKFVICCLCFIWIFSIAIAFPSPYFAETFTYTHQHDRTVCYHHNNCDFCDFAYNMFLFVITYILPLVILTIAYSRVGIELWSSKPIGENKEKHEKSIKLKKKIVKMMVVVVSIFGVCWLPQNILLISQWESNEWWFQHLCLCIYWLAMSNSMYNPIIYCWMNAKFRNGFKRAFRWLPMVKWQHEEIRWRFQSY